MKSKKGFNVDEYDPFKNFVFVYGDKSYRN